MTYALLNVPFLLASLGALLLARRRTGRPSWRVLGGTMAIMLLLTAVFDNVMIQVGLVAYDDALRLGPQVGVAPIEDFAYTVVAVLALPALWALLGRRGGARAADAPTGTQVAGSGAVAPSTDGSGAR